MALALDLQQRRPARLLRGQHPPVRPAPIAGHFNPNINADEIALFDGNGNWYIDYNHTNNVGGPGTVMVSDGLQGTPVVGDFDGSGHIEFATYQAEQASSGRST